MTESWKRLLSKMPQEGLPDGNTSIEKTCRDCGKAFKISRAERIFFESHNIALPKCCPACRKARKEARKENN